MGTEDVCIYCVLSMSLRANSVGSLIVPAMVWGEQPPRSSAWLQPYELEDGKSGTYPLLYGHPEDYARLFAWIGERCPEASFRFGNDYGFRPWEVTLFRGSVTCFRHVLIRAHDSGRNVFE